MGSYRELEVWRKSRELAVHVYRVTATFPSSEMFGLAQQMRRAAISVGSNIAEGHGRWSARDRIQFLLIARGSAYELETQIFIASDLEFIEAEQLDKLITQVNEIARMLHGLIKHYRKRAST